MVDREGLDAFFAKADDVLAEWDPSDDAMISHMSDSPNFELYNDLGYGEFWLPTKKNEPAVRQPVPTLRRAVLAWAVRELRELRLRAGRPVR
jgi:hypothetical protein